MTTTHFLVRKDALAQTRLHHAEEGPLQPGQVRLQIDHFALTSNNITYAAFGEAMHYWQFFPVPREVEDAQVWGQVPVWGFASVLASAHDDVQPGERYYGYWPMASGALLSPGRVTASGFHDTAAHRAALHPVYNQYLRCSHDPFHPTGSEAVQALMRPLFMTSWLIDDFLDDQQFFGADTVLLSSASSKTAYGTAFQLARRPGIERVGLTSAGNIDFCQALGCYDRVLSYEQLEQVRADAAAVYVDFAGNAGLRHRVHARFGQLRHSASIGGTHVDQLGGARDLPGPRATLFFAPAQIKKRHTEWGAAVLGQRMLASWEAFVADVDRPGSPWLTVQRHAAADVPAAYAQVLAGRGDPRLGHMLTLVERGAARN